MGPGTRPRLETARRGAPQVTAGEVILSTKSGPPANLQKHAFDHKFHRLEGFTAKYNVERLLYWESYGDVHKAIAREKQLKGWSRAKKIALMESTNSKWQDLAKGCYPWMENGANRDASTAKGRPITADLPPLSMTKREEMTRREEK